MKTTMTYLYRLSSGWMTEDKRTGFGDIHETGAAYFSDLVAAEAAMAQFIGCCVAHSCDRGSYWWHDYAEIDQLDEDGEIIGQPVAYWRSQPAAEVTS